MPWGICAALCSPYVAIDHLEQAKQSKSAPRAIPEQHPNVASLSLRWT
jgi:hypothetical protein